MVTEKNTNDDKKEVVTPRPTQISSLPSKIATPTPMVTKTPTPQPTFTPTPTPKVTPTPKPSPTITPTPIPTPTPEPTPDITPTPTPEPENDDNIGDIKVVINEIAWMGISGTGGHLHEWIELYNDSIEDINLEGWTLIASDDGIVKLTIQLLNSMSAGSYFLAKKKTTATTGLDVSADLIYSGNALVNSPGCYSIGLYDDNGVLHDSTGCFEDGWFAGKNEEKLTMERKDASLDGEQSSAWKDSNVAGGTPRQLNTD